MITRTTVTIRVNTETALWISQTSMAESMSVSGFVTHKILDCINSPEAEVIKTSRKIKNYERFSVTIPMDVMVNVYELSKKHSTSASKLIAAEMMLMAEKDQPVVCKCQSCEELRKENDYLRRVIADVREANKNLFGLVNFVEPK